MRFNPIDFGFIAFIVASTLAAFLAASDTQHRQVCDCCPQPKSTLAVSV